MNVLIIATHPDDEVLGCAGTMSRRAAEGDDVDVLVVTRGIPEIFPPEEIERTRSELRRAHELLRVRTCHFLDLPAPKLDAIPGHVIADAIARKIGEIKPEEVYLPHRGDLHGDHRAVYMAAMVACRPLPGCTVRRILSYETLSETDWTPPFGGDPFVPNVYVDITDHLQTKLAAMACYATQLKPPPQSRSLLAVEALARHRGYTVSVAAAEAFLLVREQC